MNTIVSYRNNQFNNKINNSPCNNKLYQANSSKVTFQGLRLPNILNSQAKNNMFNEQVDMIQYLLKMPYNDIRKATANASSIRLDFLSALSEAYSARHNAKNVMSFNESPNVVMDMFKSIKHPKNAHFDTVKNYNGTMQDMNNVFQLMGNNSKRNSLVSNMNKHIFSVVSSEPTAPNLMIDILSSEHADKYAAKFSKYKPYLLDNRTNKNAIKELDKLVSAGTYNPEGYSKSSEIANLFKRNGLIKTNILNEKAIETHYSKEGKAFLETFFDLFGVSNESLKAGNDKDILAMYKSTTNKNLKLRQKILDSYSIQYNLANISKRDGVNENIQELRRLFDNIDKNKHASSFIKKLLPSDSLPDKLQNLNEILENVPNKKLDIFADNTINILAQTSPGKKRIEILNKQIENPFYMSAQKQEYIMSSREYGLPTSEDSMLTKVGKYIKNRFNLIRYKLSGEAEPVIATESRTVPQVNKEIMQPIVLPENVKPVNNVVPEIKPVSAKPVKISRNVPKAPNTKKLEVINDVNSIIEKKLGYKTLAEQKRDYAIKATKMRMQMLPEIFDSIKETRAVERAAGKKISVSNKDAYDLYSLVKGRNKKLVNYMLKKRNADGTRMYNIKDIIKTVEQAEAKIHKAKLASPKTYKAADAKAYYNTLLEAQIQEHGKLEKSKRKK